MQIHLRGSNRVMVFLLPVSVILQNPIKNTMSNFHVADADIKCFSSIFVKLQDIIFFQVLSKLQILVKDHDTITSGGAAAHYIYIFITTTFFKMNFSE